MKSLQKKIVVIMKKKQIKSILKKVLSTVYIQFKVQFPWNQWEVGILVIFRDFHILKMKKIIILYKLLILSRWILKKINWKLKMIKN